MIKGTTRNIKTDLDIDHKMSIHNRFDIEVIDATTGRLKTSAMAENIICNQLWTYLLTLNQSTQRFGIWNQYIHFGSGSGTPSTSDTSLFTFVGFGSPMTADDVYSNNQDEHWSSVTRKIQIAPETAVGETLTEIGIAYGPGANTLCTHAMIKDMNGNQISIQKTDTDIINVYATVFIHYDYSTGFDSGKIKLAPHWSYHSINSNDISPNWLLEVLFGISYLQLQTSQFVLSSGGSAPYDYWNYGTNSNMFHFLEKQNCEAGTFSFSVDISLRTITMTAKRVAVGAGNLGGLRSLMFGAMSSRNDRTNRMMPFLTIDIGGLGLPKSSISAEALGTGDGSTIDFKTAFPVISNVIVKVDGVQASNVTVDTNVPNDPTHMGSYFQFMPEKSSTDLSYCASFNTTNVKYQQSTVTGYATYYNPFYIKGIDSCNHRNTTVSVSDDCLTWYQLFDETTSGVFNIPSEHTHKKYWRIQTNKSGAYDEAYCKTLTCNSITENNIHFATPPSMGSVITIDYESETVSKDSNHVFDFSLTLQLGEYTQ